MLKNLTGGEGGGGSGGLFNIPQHAQKHTLIPKNVSPHFRKQGNLLALKVLSFRAPLVLLRCCAGELKAGKGAGKDRIVAILAHPAAQRSYF